MPPFIHTVSESWEFPIGLTLTFVLTASVYLRGWLRLRSTVPNLIPAWRVGSLLVGLFSIWVAVGSPLATCDEGSLTVHMIQHLLLMTVGPPLIWLGAPLMPLLHGLPSAFVQRILGPVLRRPQVQCFARVVGQPAFCWFAAAAALVGWHVPAAFKLALQSEAWHIVEHASFLAAGLLFWWRPVQPWPSVPIWPRWSILLYLFLATLPCDILSAFLVFCDRVVYPVYLSTPNHFGISALEDQQCAGALMWTCVTIIYLLAATIIATRLLSTRSSRDCQSVQPDSPARVSPGTRQQSMEVV
jgi:putative membrane protein